MFRFHFGNRSTERNGFGVLRWKEGESSFLFLEFYLGSNFGLYSKRDFLTKMAEVGNKSLTEATTSWLSGNF